MTLLFIRKTPCRGSTWSLEFKSQHWAPAVGSLQCKHTLHFHCSVFLKTSKVVLSKSQLITVYGSNTQSGKIEIVLWQILADIKVLMFSLNGPTLTSFSLIFSLFKQSYEFFQQINVKKVMFIQYTVPGFEPTTSLT